MQIEVTAIENVTINDPVGIETVSDIGNPIIELDAGEVRTYDVLDQQGNRLVLLLERARLAGKLTYSVTTAAGGTAGHICGEFAFSEFPGPKSLGMVDADTVIGQVAICITTPFDGGAQITIGDAADNARLMGAGDNEPTVVGTYEVHPYYQYAADTELFLYFPAGAPTQGTGKVIIYYS